MDHQKEQHGFTYDDDNVAVEGSMLLDADLLMFILKSVGFSGKQCLEILRREQCTPHCGGDGSVVAKHHSGGGISVTITTRHWLCLVTLMLLLY